MLTKEEIELLRSCKEKTIEVIKQYVEEQGQKK